jgi:transaldolase
MGQAIFLDRDGVINRAIVRDGKPYPPAGLDELEILQDVPLALRKLKEAGYRLIVVTNQPDVARGKQSKSVVEQIHKKLFDVLPIDDILVCYHDDSDQCDCRKPAPGLLFRAAKQYDIDLNSSFMIGDRWRDIQAGQSAGCTTIWIDCHYDEPHQVQPHWQVASFADAAKVILTKSTREREMKTIQDLKVKIFADGADKQGILDLHKKPYISGFTTNPTLMRKAGVNDYKAFAKDVLSVVSDCPVSFEVFSDDFTEMERQAREIASWGPNVYVKIPVTNTAREPSYDLVKRLSRSGVKVNVTALMTLSQVKEVSGCLESGVPGFISIFAGRIADTGRDPVPVMAEAVKLIRHLPNIELIWASPRELLNIFQADAIGCHIITATYDILKKLPLIGKDLDEFSVETVQMFYDDAAKVGYKI